MTEQMQAFPVSGLQIRRLPAFNNDASSAAVYQLPATVKNVTPNATPAYLYACYPDIEAHDEAHWIQQAQSVIQAHESLRSELVDMAGLEQPLQQIHEQASPLFFNSSSAQPVAFETIVEQLQSQACRLAVVVHQQADQHQLILVGDSRFIDRPSLDLIASALLGEFEIDEEAVQYVDFIDWQEEQLQQQQRAAIAIDACHLPFTMDSAPKQEATHRYRYHEFVIGQEHSQALQELAQRHQVEYASLLFSTWQLMLSQLSDDRSIPVAWHHHGRNDELSTAVGVYECHLPIPMAKDQQRFLDLVIANESQYQQAIQEQYQLAWQQQQACHYSFEWQQLTAQAQHSVFLDETSIKLSIQKQDQSLVCYLWVDTQIYSLDYAETLAKHYAQLIQLWLAEDNNALKQDLSALRHQTITSDSASNVAENEYTGNAKNVVLAFEQQAEQHPEAIALAFKEGTLSYADLNRQSNRLAHYLVQKSLGAANTEAQINVGIYARRGPAFIIAMLACLKAGAAYVTLDPEYPAQRLQQIIEQGQLALILSAEADAETQLLSHGESDSQQAVAIVPYAQNHNSVEIKLPTDWHKNQILCENLDRSLHQEQLAYLLFTSGSTGKPKGVAVSHGNLMVSTTARIQYYQHQPSCFLVLSSLAFDSSVAGIFWSLCTGATLCLPEPKEELNILGLSVLMKRYQVSHLLCLPALYRAMLDQNIHQDCSSLKTVIVAGEACPSSLVEKHQQQSDIPLVNEYGPTEATVWCCAHTFETANKKHESNTHQRRFVPIGQAIPGTQLHVLDEQQRPVFPGVSGELYIGGANVTRGYFQQAVETAQRFYPDTLSQQHGARLYRSGDRVRQHFDGVLEFLGRNDHQVKIRGHRIELSEIERQLSSHPAVIACAVLVQQEQAGAAQNAQLIACVASNNGDESQLQYFLEQRLPAYMVPNRWMLLDQLPITANGKVNRQALQQLANEHDHQQQQRPEYVAPRSAAETVLCQLCAELMKVDQVGIRDNFFHLGGDSILSLQLVARAAKQGVEITPQELFDHPTIEDAAAIARECDPNTIAEQSNTQATTPTSNDDSSHIDVDLDDDELAALMGEIE